jgi:hypothetical protein
MTLAAVKTYFKNLMRPAQPSAAPGNNRDMQAIEAILRRRLADDRAIEAEQRRDYIVRAAELIEARQMAGSGPWHIWENRAAVNKPGPLVLAEDAAITSQGAYGDIELALQNVDWRREINLSWLEFSRWGIQQIILISRLYYIKNPIVRRLIDVCSAYVFARGVDITSPDEGAAAVIDDFLMRNWQVFGKRALIDSERRKDYDGNLFWCLFADARNTGKVSVRLIDATEIADIVCDPDDASTEWYFRRNWESRVFNTSTGAIDVKKSEAWYPSINYDPADKPASINGVEVRWNSPVYHSRSGHVANWRFGCPRVYPMIDWARASKEFLESCATTRKSLAQIAMTITTKGGQEALQGAKDQLQTTVNSQGSSLWDQQPPAVDAAVFASGPGTKLEAFKTAGAGGNPEEVRRFLLMCCMVKGVPETFLGDVSTGNLATATSLDRPTETVFLQLQEEWIEDLTTLVKFALEVSSRAPNGRLLESRRGARCEVMAMRRTQDEFGRVQWHPLSEAERKAKKAIEVKVNFPAIREGDIPLLVKATCDAMTLGNRGGQVTGIDEKEGVRKLGDLLGIENNDEIVEQMYPDNEYEVNRAEQTLAAPILAPLPAGTPQEGSTPLPGVKPGAPAPAPAPGNALAEAARRLADVAAGR